jgi:hypothetical protein
MPLVLFKKFERDVAFFESLGQAKAADPSADNQDRERHEVPCKKKE